MKIKTFRQFRFPDKKEDMMLVHLWILIMAASVSTGILAAGTYWIVSWLMDLK